MPTDTKNKGPLLVSFGNGDLNALPIEWRALMGFRQEDQQVPLGFTLEIPDPTATIVEDRLIQTRTDERKRTSVVLNPPPPNGGEPPPGGGPPDSWTLVSEQRVPWGQVATRTRAFVPQGSHLILTDDMLQAEQKNLGVGLDQDVLTCPLPGPQIVDTKWDEAASLVSTVKRRRLVAEIVDGETIIGNVWRQTSHEGETATVASEVVVTRTLPGPTVISWRIEDNGTLVTIAKTKKLTANIVEGESATTTLWTKTYGDGETALISTEVVETRALPTPAVPTSRFDDDSTIVNITRQRMLATQIVTQEIVTPTSWTKRYKEADSGLIATQVEEVRALPGAALISTHYGEDNTLVTITRTKRKADQFTDSEDYNTLTHVWTRRYREGITGLVAFEIVESKVLPGPSITSYRIDEDGATVTIVKTETLLNNIAEGEETPSATLWRKTTAEGKTVLFAIEVVESRSLLSPSVASVRIDQDGAVVTQVRTKKRISDINEAEFVSQTIWTKVFTEGVTGLVGTEVVEQRPLGPNAPIVTSTRLDRDGLVLNVSKVKKRASDITSVESGTTTSWTKVFKDEVDGLVATEVTETATLPGPQVFSTRLENDGRPTTIIKQRKFFSDIVTQESMQGTLWTKVYKEGETGKLATQVIETRDVAVNAAYVVPSFHLDQDLNTVFVKKAIKTHANITPTLGIVGNTVFVTEKNDISDLVGEEVAKQWTLLDKASFGRSVTNPLPPEFQTFAEIKDETHVVAGVAALPSALVTGQLEKTEQQIDTLTKRTGVKSILSTVPITLTGQSISTQYFGIYTNDEKKIDVWGSTSLQITEADRTDPSVISAKLERYGAYGVRTKSTIASGGYPLVYGGFSDPETGIILFKAKQVVLPGSLPVYQAGVMTEIEPLDAARSLKTVTVPLTTGGNTIANFIQVFPGTTDVSIPPQLMSLTAIDAGTSGGAGAYSSSGTYTIINQGSGRLDVRGEANSNATSMMDMVPVVKQIWGQNVRCHHYLFFIVGPVKTYDDVLARLRILSQDPNIAAWPKFQPQSVNFTLVGANMSAHAEADQHLGESTTADYLGRITRGGSTRAYGSGVSTRVDFTVKTVTIPPTIHSAISIANPVINSQNYQALAVLSTAGVVTQNIANSAVGSYVNPYQFAATPGQSVIPSGRFVHRMKVEPWKMDYFKCDCEVVSSNDW